MVHGQGIWIDLDNTPHVPFFRPIVEALASRQCPLFITARDAYNVKPMLALHGMACPVIGKHYGKNRMMKAVGLGVRALQLLPHVSARRPALAVSHGSRAQLLVAKALRIPSVVISDYEHVTHVSRPDVVIVPDLIPEQAASKYSRRVLKYPGIKEDVYVKNFQADPVTLAGLGLDDDDFVVTVRPPATEAHYYNPQSTELHDAAMRFLLQAAQVKIVLLPRSEIQKTEIEQHFAPYLQNGRIVIPTKAVDGLNLIWRSELVISGGGTMNREAAALGVPVYSTFRGTIGAVDQYLAAKGRLVMLTSTEDVPSKLVLAKRQRQPCNVAPPCATALDIIVGHLQDVLAKSNNTRLENPWKRA